MALAVTQVTRKLASYNMKSDEAGCGEVTRLNPHRAVRGLPDRWQCL